MGIFSGEAQLCGESSPGKGIGANTALRDASLLCKKLIEVRNGKKS
ncbi:FAD-dependent monooxygenase [Paenibacillus chitinolyticus]